MSEHERPRAAALALAVVLAVAAGVITSFWRDTGPAEDRNRNQVAGSGEKLGGGSGLNQVAGLGKNQLAVGEGPGGSVGDAGVRDTSGRDASLPVESAVVRLIRSTDEADRSLLAEVERIGDGVPSEAVPALLALRRAGARREELERFIAGRLGSPLALRLAARRWLNAVAPAADAAPASPVVPSSFGRGGGARRVQPIERR